MEQRERFQIDYQLNKKELWEMSLRMTVDSFFQNRLIIFLGITWLIAAIFLTFIEMPAGGRLMSLIFRVLPILIIFVLILLSTHLLTYRNLLKNGFLNAGRLSLENGYVKMEKPEVFVSPVSSYTKIIKGRTVLLLGQKLSDKMTSYVGISRRAFASNEELNSFVAALGHSSVQEGSVLNEQEVNRECDFVIAFEVTQEQWIQIYDEMLRVLNNTSSGRRRRVFLMAGVGMLTAATMAVTMFIEKYSLMQAIIVSIILIVVMGILITSVYFQKPDIRYQKWMEKGLMQTDTIGQWEIGICTDGCYMLHNGKYLRLYWSEYFCRYETMNTVYFWDQKMKHYLFIPKKSLGGEESQERFFAYFRQLNMEFTKAKRYG